MKVQKRLLFSSFEKVYWAEREKNETVFVA